MQTRRSLLVTTSTATCWVLAGCLGDDSGGNSEETYDEAVSYLEENAGTLDEFAERDGIPDQFAASTVEDRADLAEEKLDEFEDGASDEQQERVVNARAIATYQREAAEYNGMLVEFDNCLDTVDAYVDAGRFEATSDELSACRDTFDDITNQLDRVESAHGEIDPSLVEDESELEYERNEVELQLARVELDALDRFIEGFTQFIGGTEAMVGGFESYEDENFGSAATQFETAEGQFEESEETLALLEADPDTPQQLKPDVVEFHCAADAFYTATGHYADAARAAANRNWATSDDRFEDGNAALEQCE